MSDQLKEQISAFVDGELSEHETELLLKRLERDSELRATLVRYSSIGYGVRDRHARGASIGFAGRVSAAVAAETASPERSRTQTTLVAGSKPRWLRPVAGFAVAATVAVVAILGVQQLQGTGDSAVTQMAATDASATSPVVIGDLPVNEAPSYTVPEPTTDSPIVPAARLTNYVVAHSQYSSALQGRNVLSGIIAEDPTPLDESGNPVDATKDDATAPAPVVTAPQP